VGSISQVITSFYALNRTGGGRVWSHRIPNNRFYREAAQRANPSYSFFGCKRYDGKSLLSSLRSPKFSVSFLPTLAVAGREPGGDPLSEVGRTPVVK
jgi:hypothetical protein